MVPGHIIRFFCLLLVPGVVGTLRVSAQSGGSFTTTCNVLKSGVADQIEVTYTIRDIDNIVTFSAGNLKDFVVLAGPFESRSESAFIGRGVNRSTEVNITYVVQPRRPGNLTIPPAIARDASGKSIQSNPVTVQIVPGSTKPVRPRQAPLPRRQTNAYDPSADPYYGNNAGIQRMVPQNNADLSKEIFLRLEVDKTAVTVGEPIIASYKLYTRVPMSTPGLSRSPVLNGFWSEEFNIPGRPQPVRQMIDGRGYESFLLKKIALYPTEAGNLTIDPASAEVIVKLQRSGDDPFGFNDDPMFSQAFPGDPFGDYTYENVPLSLQSRPLTVTVTPAPVAGRPDSWSGAVGQFDVSTRLVQHTVTEEDEALLQLIVRGNGNLALLKPPALRLPAGLHSTESGVKDTTFGPSGEKGRIFNYLISAAHPGTYHIPSVSLPYYNPEMRTYQAATSGSATLQVEAGAGLADEPKPLAARAAIAVNPLASGDGKANGGFVSSPVFWTVCTLPLAFLIFLAARRRRPSETKEAPVAMQVTPAGPAPVAPVFTQPVPNNSAQLLTVAGSALDAGQYPAFYRNTCTAVAASMRAILGAPSISQMSQYALREALGGHGVPDHVTLSALEVMKACDSALYAPPGAVPDEQSARNIYAAAQSSVQALSAFPQMATA